MKSTYYLNGKYIEASKALISVDDRGFQFSDGIYEVIWICDSNPIDIGDHFLRLKSSLKEISLNVKIDLTHIRRIIKGLIRYNKIYRS